jgi:proteic killer suppression protein
MARALPNQYFDTCKITLYGRQWTGSGMIESFRHKGLRQLFEHDDAKGLNPQHARKIRQILALMHAAEKISDLDYATFRLHPLKGKLAGFWSITVRANWRIIFRFESGKAFEVDFVDYH